MARTTSAEFDENSQHYQKQAAGEPVEITRDGKRALVLMSANHYDWLRAAAQRTHRTAATTAVVIQAVEGSEMDKQQFDHLDALLK